VKVMLSLRQVLLARVADNCGKKKQTASIRLRSQSLNPRPIARGNETLFTMSLNKRDEMETELTCDIDTF